MGLLENLSIRTRLTGSFMLMLGLMLTVVVTGVLSNRATLSSVDDLVQKEFKQLQLVSAIDSATKDNSRNTLELFVVNSDKRDAVRTRLADTRQRLNGMFDELGTLIHTQEDRALFNELQAKRTEFVKKFTAASELLRTGQDEDATFMLNLEVLPALDALRTPINKLLANQQKAANLRSDSVETALHGQNTQLVGLGVVSLVMALAVSVLLMRSIMRPIHTAMRVAEEVANGNLTVEFEAHGQNELAVMLRAIQRMKDALCDVLGRIQESAMAVSAASNQIASANADLSARTETQASSLQQTASSMEQMTGAVQQNAQTTLEVSQLAASATQSAQEVGQLVGSVVDTMHGIHASSQRITDIVGVIDSIAFQTNILALNAAVEAARAGDQGRGFAVVAAEVRALAKRSAAAAQEIKTIITDNANKLDAGNVVVQKAGDAVMVAVQAIQKVDVSVSSIELASREQSTGIAQVGQAVAQIDQTTQQNAALVEETAAAARSLDDQVQVLTDSINRFKLTPRTPAPNRLIAVGFA